MMLSDLRGGRRLSRALVAATLATASLFAGATVASALTNEYCGGQVDQGRWCSDSSQRAYYYNRAEHNGSVNVTVCERMRIANTDVVRAPVVCGSNYVARDYGVSGCCYEPEVSHRNSGGARRTVLGVAKT